MLYVLLLPVSTCSSLQSAKSHIFKETSSEQEANFKSVGEKLVKNSLLEANVENGTKKKEGREGGLT